MPVTKSAKKALKVAGRRKLENDRIKKTVRGALKKFRSQPSQNNLKKVYSIIDRAVRKNVFHKNKGARLKSALAKLTVPAGKNKSKKI